MSSPRSTTFLIVTDRAELDDQIAGTFSACGELTKPRESVLPPIYQGELWPDKVERTYAFVYDHFGAAPASV